MKFNRPQLFFEIADRAVGPGHPCFIIAEVGVNHNGNTSLALDLIDIASAAGADAVKFQTFSAARLVTKDAQKADYQKRTTDPGESQFEMLQKLELSDADHLVLMERCAKKNIVFLSTPFDEQSADMLRSINVPAFKTPSGDLTNLPYLAHIAGFGKPMIVSTGMATLAEVDAAVHTITTSGCSQLALLHCVSNYPADPATVNLRAMESMHKSFGVPVGYSDHTNGIEISLAAVALGASIIEKHFTLDRGLPGPDHKASLEPGEIVELVRSIRSVESAIGDGRKVPTLEELSTAKAARKSVVTTRFLRAGEIIGNADIAMRRPGSGIPPAFASLVIGRTTRVDISDGIPLSWEMLL